MKTSWPQVVTALGGWAVISGGTAGFLSKLLTERLLSRWRRDEQVLVESIRGEMASNNSLFQAAIASFSAGQASVLEARLSAVHLLWKGVIELREKFSSVVFFFTVLLPSEYDDALAKDDTLAAGVRNVDDKFITEAMQQTKDLEADRPLLGETLWLQFFIYRSFLGRLALLLKRGKEKGHVEDWKLDPGVRQLLGHVLGDSEVEGLMINPTDVTAIQRAIKRMESLILEEMSQLTSGKRSSVDSFEHAKELRSAVENLESSGLS